MNRMARFLFNTEMPLWRYILVLLPLIMIPAMAMINAVRFGLEFAGVDLTRFSPPPVSSSATGAFGSIIFAPFIETYLLAVLITILSSFIPNRIHVVVVSGLMWGAFHAVFGLLWFFGAAWAFFMFSCAFIAWRQKSFKHAYFAAFVPHVLNNAIVILASPLIKHA